MGTREDRPGPSSRSEMLEKHRALCQRYLSYKQGRRRPEDGQEPKTRKTDHDELKATYRFIRSPKDDALLEASELRVAKKYYAKLFKVSALAFHLHRLRSRSKLRASSLFCL